MPIVISLIALLAFAASLTPASANEWCGFHHKNHSQVRCGYSSIQQCKDALGNNAVCVPDPTFGAIEARQRAS